MELVYVDSSNIDRVGHDEQSGELQVHFRDGSSYSYAGVPRDVYASLLDADSVGSYFNRAVRGVYEHHRI